MGRRIISEQLESGSPVNIPPDDYTDRLIKYIPTEAVGLWLVLNGAIQSFDNAFPKVGSLWFCFVTVLVFTFLWIRQRTREPQKPTAWTQILISCGAFVVWVFAMGGPFAASWEGYHPGYGALLLPIYTAGASFVIPPER